MNRLKPDQKQKVRNFIQWTQTYESIAIEYLTKSSWNVEYATQLYYDNPMLFEGSGPGIDRNRIDRMFYSYCDERDKLGPKRMGPHGIQRLLHDLGYDPCDRKVLLFACKLKASTQCEFSYEEWVTGMTNLRADSLETLKDRLNCLNAELSADQAKFKDLYSFTFNYGKPASQRSLDMETAIAYWHILFEDQYPVYSKWEAFLREEHKGAITRDTWNLLLDFLNVVKPDLSDYDDEGAWPVLIDQFVEYARNKYDLPKPVNPDAEVVYSSYY